MLPIFTNHLLSSDFDIDEAVKPVLIREHEILELTEGTSYEIKGKLEFYNASIDVLDFGKLNNTECIEEKELATEYTYSYNATVKDFVNYLYAIKEKGYQVNGTPLKMGRGRFVIDYIKEEREIHIIYSTNKERVIITLFKDGLM